MEEEKEKKPSGRPGYGKVVFPRRYNRRLRNFDYSRPAIYHIILKKAPGCPAFGNLAGDPAVRPGEPGCARIDKTPLGKLVNKEIYNWPLRFPVLQLYQYTVMPDHVHILLRVKEEIPLKLGFYVGKLNEIVQKAWTGVTVGEASPAVVFQEGYTDRVLHPGRDLDTLFRYIRENPHRLAMRKLHPEFFQTLRNIEIAGEQWQAYGNLFLLRDPFVSAVVVHTRHTPEERAALREEWLWNAANGGVLASPFISPAENAIREEAEKLGSRIIHIQETPFPDRYKPEERRFNLCCEGKLLILAPMRPLPEERFRYKCLHMNRIAEYLASLSASRR